jgi:hypothetical protein
MITARGKDVSRARASPGKSAEFILSKYNLINTARWAKFHITIYMC